MADPTDQRRDLSRDDRLADFAFAASAVGALLLWCLLYLEFPGLAAMLFLAAILAYALLPIVDRLHGAKIPRTLGVLLVALVGAGLVTLLVLLLAPMVAEQLAKLPDAVRHSWAQAQALWDRMQERLPPVIAENLERIRSWAREQIQGAAPEGTTLTSWATAAAGGVTAVASAVIFVPIFVFLMLRSYHPFVASLRGMVPPRWRDRFDLRGAQADGVLSGFVRGQLLVALIIGCLYALGFTLVGVPLGLVVGLLAGLGELIPYVGGAVALLLASLLALAGGQPSDVLWVVAIFVAVQLLEGGLISPWIVGRRARLGPGVVIVALAVGGELFGFIGLLAAVPAAALLKVAGRAAVDAYRATPFFLRRRSA